MAFFDSNIAIDNSKLPELRILLKKTSNSQKKGILYFSRDDVTLAMTAKVQQKKDGKEVGKIYQIDAEVDGKPAWYLKGLNYDFNQFWKDISKGKISKIINKIFSKKDTIWGSPLDDKLYGFKGNDTLNGWQGDDRLNGGPGKDKLKGYTGADTFVFDQALKSGNVDKIQDFKSKQGDRIELDKDIFSGFSKGKLGSSYFTVGTKAVGDDPQIVYNKKSGKIYYDSDGAGGDAMLHFATVKKKTILSHDDFFVS